MKKLILPIVALLLLSFSKDSFTKLSEKDREFILKHLTESKEHLDTTLQGLTKAQLNFKPTANSWSIAECAEHLALSEKIFLQTVHNTIAEGPKTGLKDSLAFRDEQIMPMSTNRSQKVKTAKPFEPSGKFGSTAETFDAFLESRNELTEYVKTTDDDLRNHFNSDFPFGTVDAVQLIVFVAGHTERHILQMKEVMEHEGFPKE